MVRITYPDVGVDTSKKADVVDTIATDAASGCPCCAVYEANE